MARRKDVYSRGNFTDEAAVEIASALIPRQKQRMAWKIPSFVVYLLCVAYFMIIIVELYTFHHIKSPLLAVALLW